MPLLRRNLEVKRILSLGDVLSEGAFGVVFRWDGDRRDARLATSFSPASRTRNLDSMRPNLSSLIATLVRQLVLPVGVGYPTGSDAAAGLWYEGHLQVGAGLSIQLHSPVDNSQLWIITPAACDHEDQTHTNTG